MKKAGIICANGIGDALLMMIAANTLKNCGYIVTVFSPKGSAIAPLFEEVNFHPLPDEKNLQITLHPFHLVLVENDNSKLAWDIIRLRKQNLLNNVRFLFPKPSRAQTDQDILFDSSKTVVDNLSLSMQQLLSISKPCTCNGLKISKSHIYRCFPKRVIIHPTSQNKNKNWPKKKFLQLAEILKKNSFDVAFVMSKQEAHEWSDLDKYEYERPLFDHLQDLKNYLFESGYFIGNDSGIGHLASNLKIPTLTISSNRKLAKLWRPGWYYGKVVFPSTVLPNFKGINFAFRDKHWSKFISVRKVLNNFYKLVYRCP